MSDRTIFIEAIQKMAIRRVNEGMPPPQAIAEAVRTAHNLSEPDKDNIERIRRDAVSIMFNRS